MISTKEFQKLVARKERIQTLIAFKEAKIEAHQESIDFLEDEQDQLIAQLETIREKMTE
jgi:hypothetical protein